MRSASLQLGYNRSSYNPTLVTARWDAPYERALNPSWHRNEQPHLTNSNMEEIENKLKQALLAFVRKPPENFDNDKKSLDGFLA